MYEVCYKSAETKIIEVKMDLRNRQGETFDTIKKIIVTGTNRLKNSIQSQSHKATIIVT